MSSELRPMSTGELLDRTFGLYKRHFVLFLGISVPAPALMMLLIVISAILEKLPGNQSPGRTAEIVGAVIAAVIAVVCVLALLLGFALAQAATIRAVSALHLSRPTGIRSAYRQVRGHYLRIVSIFISVAIRIFGGSLLIYIGVSFLGVLAVGTASRLGRAGVIVGVIVAIAIVIGGILLALTLFVRYSYAVQACVVEDIPARQAIKRSVFLSRGSRNRILTVYVLFWFLFSAVWGCLALLVSLCESLLIRSPQVITPLMWLAFFATMVLTVPLVTVAISLGYYDERVRKEGFDLQVLIEGLESTSATVQPPTATAM